MALAIPDRFYDGGAVINSAGRQVVIELKKLHGRRTYLKIENRSTNAVYLFWDRQGSLINPDTDIGTKIPAGVTYELWIAVPNNENGFIVPSPGVGDQQVNITEGYEEVT